MGYFHHSSSTVPRAKELWSSNSHPSAPFPTPWNFSPIPAISRSTYIFSSLSQALKTFYQCMLVLFFPQHSLKQSSKQDRNQGNCQRQMHIALLRFQISTNNWRSKALALSPLRFPSVLNLVLEHLKSFNLLSLVANDQAGTRKWRQLPTPTANRHTLP